MMDSFFYALSFSNLNTEMRDDNCIGKGETKGTRKVAALKLLKCIKSDTECYVNP